METSCDRYVSFPQRASAGKQCPKMPQMERPFSVDFSVSMGEQGNESDENSLNLAEYTAKTVKRKGKH
jgi:hypothetical protein